MLLSLAALLWWGSWLCTEEFILKNQPSPNRLGFFLGIGILTFCVIRGNYTVHPDNLLLIYPALAGFGLALLYQPTSQIDHLRSSFLILFLLPLYALIYRLLSLPEQAISRVTAVASGLLLTVIGRPVTIQDTKIFLPGGGVQVYGPCNGTDMVSLLVVVAILFMICFPLRSWIHRVLVISLAPVLALISNTFRIALLALINADPSPASDARFDFFHEGSGSLLFSAIAVSIVAILYLSLLHKQFSIDHQHPR